MKSLNNLFPNPPESSGLNMLNDFAENGNDHVWLLSNDLHDIVLGILNKDIT